MPRQKTDAKQGRTTLWLLEQIEEFLTINEMENDGNSFGGWYRKTAPWSPDCAMAATSASPRWMMRLPSCDALLVFTGQKRVRVS